MLGEQHHCIPTEETTVTVVFALKDEVNRMKLVSSRVQACQLPER